MAFALQYSDQAAAQLPGGNKADGADVWSDLRVAYFSYTHTAGADTGEINLLTLPPGKIRIYKHLSTIVASDMAASSTMDVGHRAYVQPDGTAVVEDDDEFVSDAAVNTGPLEILFSESEAAATDIGVASFETKSGFVIFASIDSGNIENGDTLEGYVVYQYANV